jgi:hypothetical protein
MCACPCSLEPDAKGFQGVTDTSTATSLTIERRGTYLLVTELAPLQTLDDVDRFFRTVDQAAKDAGERRGIIDARGGAWSERSGAVRVAVLERLCSARVLERVAIVLPTELAVMATNMSTLAAASRVRAFLTLVEAQRWLSQRSSSTSFAAVGATIRKPDE